MSKAMASRMYQVVMMGQPAMHRRTTPTITATAAAAAATTTTTAVATRRGISSDTPDKQEQMGGGEKHNQTQRGGTDAGEAPVVDEASARRAALLKRYGDRTAPSGPIAVKVDPAAEDARKSAGDEADHNEIWGDYVNYMEHQRKKGWKT